jgi:hypothetical protein
VQIWRDKWLPTSTLYAIQSPRKVLLAGAIVSDLIDINSKWWNRSFLNTLFCKEEAKVISRILLSNYSHEGLIVVNAINRSRFNWSLYGNLISDIQGFLQAFQNWTLYFTPRGANWAIHSLAKE